MNKQRIFGRAAIAAGLAVAVLGSTGNVSAQDVDGRWLPFLGCWTPSAEGTGIDLVCLRPAAQQGGVELLRIADNAVTGREVLWADGVRHDTSRESCDGWEQGSFSEDGRRLFMKGEYTCDGVTQEVGGVISMASPAAWLDVRVAGMDGERVAWVQRYHVGAAEDVEAAGFGDILADRSWSVATARVVASAGLDVEDVIEASAELPDEAVQALLAELATPFDLTAADLIRMADAGVSGDVIDVAVAVSYPHRFTLDNGPEQVASSALDRGSLRRRWAYDGYAGPAFYDPFYSPWSLRYGYGSMYGYGSYGYGSYGYGYGGYGYGGFGGYPYGYRPTVVVVDPVQREHGRVVNGRGYSRGGSGSTGSSGSYGPSRASGGSTAGAARSTGSSGAATSRGSGTSTGRTAKPRGGGR
jgi:hypothetical protein